MAVIVYEELLSGPQLRQQCPMTSVEECGGCGEPCGRCEAEVCFWCSKLAMQQFVGHKTSRYWSECVSC
jgi:hypothetical protein